MECPLREPSLTFRRYQADVLGKIGIADREMLIVAPPGSGKTIIGLELIRRIGAPAIVFSPTTIIAKQWKEKLGFFCDDSDAAASLDSDKAAFINIFTYQRISTRAQATDAMRAMAREMWLKELQKTMPPEEAEAEIARIEKSNMDYFGKKIASYVSRLRSEYDRSVVERGLHRNALALIQRMKDAGVKVIILDECHHLLDYWGLVISYLKDVLSAQVIGLTATYPIADEKDVFFELLGSQVDYEVSVPAVVKEGYLAPYRELARFMTPTDEEIRFIESEIKRADAVFAFVSGHRIFSDFRSAVEEGDAFKKDYGLFEAVISRKGDYKVASYDEKLILIKGFLDYAFPLMEESERKAVFHTLKSCGMSYSNRALHVSSSVERYVLSYSESRVRGAIDVLRKEERAMGKKLRALVMADFDMHVPAKKVRPGKMMGSATFIFLRMMRELDDLDPVLVTGKRLYCDDDAAVEVCSEMERLARTRKLDVKIRIRGMDGYAVLEGSGADWKPSTYTLLVTELFSEGMTRLLIGTKGIFGEGWDSLKLNTLVDLTAISYGTSVQQIKGRTLRLDPEDPAKVSNNWDIVCIYPGMRSQLSKMRKKHMLVYGTDDNGDVTKGLHHLDGKASGLARYSMPDQAFYLALAEMNERMDGRSADRARTAALWKVGAAYDDRETAAVSAKLKRKIVPVQTLRWFYTVIKLFLSSSVMLFFFYALFSGDAAGCLAAFLLWLLLVFGVSCAAYIHLLRNPVPDEKVVSGMAKAVFNSLKRLNITDDSATFRLAMQDDGMVEAALYGKGSRDFARAMDELLSRPINPRYIILYDVAQPMHLLFGWYGVFSRLAEDAGIKRQYFAVPALFAANKKNMQVFASEWEMHVGGGRFVYTRSEGGFKLLRSLVKSGVTDWLAEASRKIYWDYVGTAGRKVKTLY